MKSRRDEEGGRRKEEEEEEKEGSGGGAAGTGKRRETIFFLKRLGKNTIERFMCLRETEKSDKSFSFFWRMIRCF